MTNISSYPSHSADSMYPLPVVNQRSLLDGNPSVYPTILQILTQLRAAESEWNAWKAVSTSYQMSLHREQQLRMKDKLNYHMQEQQFHNQIELLRLQLDKATEANAAHHRDIVVLQQNLSICKGANLHAQSSKQDLEHLNRGISALKEDVLNLSKVIQKKDELLLQTVEEAKRNKEKLQEALKTIKDKDAQLENIGQERNALKENLELTKEEIGKLKLEVEEYQSKFQTTLEQKLNSVEAILVEQAQLNNHLTMQRDELKMTLVDLKNSSKEEKHDISEELKRFKEEFGKLKAQEAESQFKSQKDFAENLNTMSVSLTKQARLNEELTKQNNELKNSLTDLKNKSECEKREINELMNNFKEEMIKLKAEERESQSKVLSVLEEKLNVFDTLTKQVQLNEELNKQREELRKSLADLMSKSEGEKRVINEDLRICKESALPVMGPCGPTQLRQIKMPQAEGGLYKTVLTKHMLPGCVIQVIGSFKSTGDTPSINLDFLLGIALHIVFRFTSGHICRNTYSDGKWGPEETGGGMPVQRGQQFILTITSTAENFQICINGVMFATYKHRIEKHAITGIWIGGPIELQEVLYFAPANI